MTVSVASGPVFSKSVRTENAAATELSRWVPELDSSSIVELTVTGSATSGDRLTYRRLYKVTRKSTTGTVITAMAAATRRDTGSGTWVVDLAVDGADGISAVVTVTGEVGHDITWQGTPRRHAEGRDIVRYWSYKCVELEAGEYIDCGDNCDRDITDPFSLSIWVKPTSTGSAHNFIAKHGGGGGGGYVLGCNSSGAPFIYVEDDVGNHIEAISSGTTLTWGAWNHVVGTYSAATQTQADLKLYVAGAAIGIGTVADLLTGTSVNAAALKVGSGLPYNYVGRIDDPLVYSDELTGGEVTWLYNSGKPRNPADAGGPGNNILALRCGDEDTYPTCTDYSGSGFNGTLTNTEGDEFKNDAPGI